MTTLSAALAGMNRAETKLETTGERLARLTLQAGDADRVDLSAEAVALIEARIAYQTNVKVAQTAAEMSDKIGDLIA